VEAGPGWQGEEDKTLSARSTMGNKSDYVYWLAIGMHKVTVSQSLPGNTGRKSEGGGDTPRLGRQPATRQPKQSSNPRPTTQWAVVKPAMQPHTSFHNIRRINPYLITNATQLLVQAIVISHLHYCNSFLSGLLASLQLIYNIAPHVMFNLSKRSHVSHSSFLYIGFLQLTR
ncbi:hypothetical protein Z043_100702, partial [Scleropages formosus]